MFERLFWIFRRKLDIPIVKLREDAVIPEYKTLGAAGFDFYAAIDDKIEIEPNEWAIVPFGIAMEVPIGYELRIRSRSGPVFKGRVTAYHGLIDSDFRGELSVLLHNQGKEKYVVQPGDRCAQGVILRYEVARFRLVDKLSETERGSGGFGSTGTS